MWLLESSRLQIICSCSINHTAPPWLQKYQIAAIKTKYQDLVLVQKSGKINILSSLYKWPETGLASSNNTSSDIVPKSKFAPTETKFKIIRSALAGIRSIKSLHEIGHHAANMEKWNFVKHDFCWNTINPHRFRCQTMVFPQKTQCWYKTVHYYRLNSSQCDTKHKLNLCFFRRSLRLDILRIVLNLRTSEDHPVVATLT